LSAIVKSKPPSSSPSGCEFGIRPFGGIFEQVPDELAKVGRIHGHGLDAPAIGLEPKVFR